MEDQIPEDVKHERFNRVLSKVNEILVDLNASYVGKTVEVLIEGKSKTNDKILTGRTETNKVVNFEGSDELIGNIVELKIISEHMWYLKGEVL